MLFEAYRKCKGKSVSCWNCPRRAKIVDSLGRIEESFGLDLQKAKKKNISPNKRRIKLRKRVERYKRLQELSKPRSVATKVAPRGGSDPYKIRKCVLKYRVTRETINLAKPKERIHVQEAEKPMGEKISVLQCRFSENIARLAEPRIRCDVPTRLLGKVVEEALFAKVNIASPPARTVEMVVKIAGINVECREVDVINGENTEPWFLKLNPTRQVPVLDDNGYILTDSHAIVTYLLDVHAPKDISEELYPSDPKKRGIINSALHFDNGVLFARIKTIFIPLFFWGEKETHAEKVEWLAEAVDFLDKMLEGKEWLAGDHLTVADISVTTTMDLVEIVLPITHFKNLSEWTTRVRATCPFYKEVSEERLSKMKEQMAEYISGAAGRWDLVKNKYLH